MKKLQKIFLITITALVLAVILFIYNQYVYMELDSSDFPLVQRWSSNLGEKILELSASDEGDLIFVRTVKALYAANSESGQILWRFPLGYQAKTHPAIAKNGIVYIADAKHIWALDQKNGNTIWTQALADPRGKVEDVSDHLIFVNNKNSDIEAYDTKTGSLLWAFPLYWYHPAFYVSENKIYIPETGLVVIDIASGGNTVINRSDSIFDSDIHGDSIYYVTLDNIVAFSTRTETEIWRQRRPFSDNDFPRLDVYDQFIMVEGARSLAIHNSETGVLIWKASISYPISPSFIGDMLFVMGGFDRTIRVFQATTGKDLGQLRTSSYQLLRAPRQQEMIATNNLLVFSRGNELLCFITADK